MEIEEHRADIRFKDIGIAGNPARAKKHAAVQSHYREFMRQMADNLRSTEPTFIKALWRDNGKDVLITFLFTDAETAVKIGAEFEEAWGPGGKTARG